MAVQGHPTHPSSLILVPTENAYSTSYWSSIVTLLLSCSISEISQGFLLKEGPYPYSTRILGLQLLTVITVIKDSFKNLKLDRSETSILSSD